MNILLICASVISRFFGLGRSQSCDSELYRSCFSSSQTQTVGRKVSGPPECSNWRESCDGVQNSKARLSSADCRVLCVPRPLPQKKHPETVVDRNGTGQGIHRVPRPALEARPAGPPLPAAPSTRGREASPDLLHGPGQVQRGLLRWGGRQEEAGAAGRPSGSPAQGVGRFALLLARAAPGGPPPRRRRRWGCRRSRRRGGNAVGISRPPAAAATGPAAAHPGRPAGTAHPGVQAEGGAARGVGR